MSDSRLLQKKLKEKIASLEENHAIRLHRAISWIRCAEKNRGDYDLTFLGLWVSLNSLYANVESKYTYASERESLRSFLEKLVAKDGEKRFFNLIWHKYSGPIRLLLDNKFVFGPFWEHQRGIKVDWVKEFDKVNRLAHSSLAKEDVVPLMLVIMDRLYQLRNMVAHGGSTYNSKVNRKQLKDACAILSSILPVMIDIMLEYPEGWGSILYPVVEQ